MLNGRQQLVVGGIARGKRKRRRRVHGTTPGKKMTQWRFMIFEGCRPHESQRVRVSGRLLPLLLLLRGVQ